MAAALVALLAAYVLGRRLAGDAWAELSARPVAAAVPEGG